MTEDEAKQRWCPFVRLAVAGGPPGAIGFAYNRVVTGITSHNPTIHENSVGTACIASKCMAWRAKTSQQKWLVSLDGKPAEEWGWDPTGSGSFAGRVAVQKLDAHSQGFCGLAGAVS